ncbi:tRNA uridine-5-carboxymethylaminomethyl(34) synthesis GTPase MnmE [uncultured Alistipes sp.]|uniref:tRNA uridine-5-carboxymethylaminomethyl(34) synthesis GTPase MnmE n=1 Tax=uncultured Alistipes sp. TaxID=538949 RepID=UPI0025E7EA6C|nr:tRNA uridine-5-carboxymethylaminomethyl(34) synthesis GTPase MnmE [uncultured Alistipes sp.]
MPSDRETIVAPATAPGGALAVVRISGPEALACCDRIFRGRQPLAAAEGYTVHYGRIVDDGRTVDDVLATVFRAPRSYTGEDAVELSCHGSSYVVGELLRLLREAGCRTAEPGEFTLRAYLNGKMDLSQAEAVADLIASSSRAAHTMASTQMRGGYSAALDTLRDELLRLTALLELELDFSEEEVEFADRGELRRTMERIGGEIASLRGSFALGNALREGVAVALVGAPNAGKSTLLNRLAGDERAMVSDIAGTTRDVVEERVVIDQVLFRLLDTAGLRTTDDRLERMGIERTHSSIARAAVVVRLLDATALDEAATPDDAASFGDATTLGGTATPNDAATLPAPDFSLRDEAAAPDSTATRDDATTHHGTAAPKDAAPLPPPDFSLRDDQRLLTVINKIDLHPGLTLPAGTIGISAREGRGIDALRAALRAAVDTEALYHGDAVVSHTRHYAALDEAGRALDAALAALDQGLPADLLSEEIRAVIHHLGSITSRGAIASEEVLASIFSKFCIGK